MEEGLSKQALHTEKLIEKMLEFLNSSGEVEEEEEIEDDDEEFDKHIEGDNDNLHDEEASPLPASQVKNHKLRFKKNLNSDEEELTDTEEHSEEEYFREPLLYKDQHLYWSYGKSLKQQYHSLWNNKDIIENKEKLPSDSVASISTNVTSPIWQTCKKTYSLDGSSDADTIEIGEDWFKWKLNNRRNNNIAYIQEVQRAIYSNTIGFPMCESENYFKAAQNYAAYGTDFLDFPVNLLSLWSDTDTCSPNSRNSSGNLGNSTSSPSSISSDESTQLGYNHFTKSTATCNTSNTTSTTSTMAASNIPPTGFSTPAYYHVCTGNNQPPRPSAFNTATAAAAYGMFFGNKVTYLPSATPNAPTLIYNAHTSAANTNFLSNNLANAVLANAPPALFYSNPMLPNTTQHYLNSFFKETQYLSTVTNAINVHGTTFYERLVYAQMLQQQIYHQTQQQAAAVASMFQKQRSPAASLPAPGRNITTTTTNSAATSISAPMTKPKNAVVNHCSRHKVMPPSTISHDIVLLKNHTKHIVPKSAKGNNNDDTKNGLKE